MFPYIARLSPNGIVVKQGREGEGWNLDFFCNEIHQKITLVHVVHMNQPYLMLKLAIT